MVKIIKKIQEVLEFKIIELDNFSLSIYHVFLVFAIIGITRLILWAIKKMIHREGLKQKVGEGRQHALFQIFKYFIIVIAVVVVLESLGVKVTILLAGSAALLVGLGLGLQQIFHDFISGLILLFEGTIKVGEVIEIEGIVGRVIRIGLRTAEIETRDNIMMIIPNSKFTSEKVINWSHTRRFTRFKINVGVAYGSDSKNVKRVLLECAANHNFVATKPEPTVRFIDFGDSALLFELLFFSENMFRIEKVKSDIRFIIDRKFRDNGIHIPFPQRDLHVVSESVSDKKSIKQIFGNPSSEDKSKPD